MLRTWSFWKTFFTAYIALVAGIWGFVEAYTYFESDSLKQLLGSNWWIYYYLLPLFIAFSVATLTNAKLETQAETLDQRNRRVMLDHVENFWVKGILEKSLHGAALLELGIKEDPSAVSYPWTIKRESTNETLSAGKSMLEIFKEIGMGRSLLILGAPGSGKTTMLMELTRQLIERARLDETEPIPVVFNLASWKENQTLAHWLAEQLNIIYCVPKKTALVWVSENRMLLLLDGLDEVKKEGRVRCVDAINHFRKELGLTSLIVCSRSEEYEALNARLALEGAITLQPLSSKQINAYFERFGTSLAAVKGLIQKDKALQELAETPLMLSIMALAYKDTNATELLVSGSIEEQRKHLFNTYIKRMFERSTRTANAPFSKQQTLYYLNWLARKMIQHSIITYQIEAMQPGWLEEETHRRLYSILVRVMYGVMFGLSAGLTFGLLTGLFSGFSGRLFVGLISGLILGLISGLLGLFFGQIFELTGEIIMVDKLKWSGEFRILIIIISLISGLFFGLAGTLINGLIFGLIFGLIIWLISGLMLVLVIGVVPEQVEETTRPGQRLRQTLINAVFVGMSSCLIAGLLIGLWVKVIADPVDRRAGLLAIFMEGSLVGALTLGVISGIGGGLLLGGAAFFRHYVLRFILIRNKLLPRDLTSFLVYAVDLIFLRRVGGSYIFVHRTLMEHFAEMEV